MAGLLQATWWAARLGMAALSVAFYAHFAVAEAAGTPCDAPLLAFIVSAGTLSAVLVLLRGAVLAVGIGERSAPVRFLLQVRKQSRQLLVIYWLILTDCVWLQALPGAAALRRGGDGGGGRRLHPGAIRAHRGSFGSPLAFGSL